MTLQQKLGQLLMIGFPGTELDDASIELIEKYKAGNIILFSRNLTSPKQMRSLCDDLKKRIKEATGYTPIIAIDQEGGIVSRVPSGTTIFPSAMAVAAAGEPEDAEAAAYYSARELAALGVNCNFAPVVDVNTNPQNPVIGVRSYGNTVDHVIKYSDAVHRGILRAGLLLSTKHFPGHGDTAVDSHLGLPVVEKSREELFECELAPFVDAIKKGSPCVMVSHMLFPAFDDSGVPASMSRPIMTDLLRGEMGFDGLIVSDCLEMGAIKDHYGTPQAFLEGIKSGLDLGCISHLAPLALEALRITEKAVKDGSLPMDRVDDAVARVLEAKRRFADADAPFEAVGCEEHTNKAKELMQGAITRFDDNTSFPTIDADTHFVSCPVYRATFASSTSNEDTFAQHMAKRFGAKHTVVPVKPQTEDIESVLSATDEGQTVVVGTYNGHLNTEQLHLIEELHEKGRCVVAVALRNPYDLLSLPEAVYKLCAFEYSSRSFDAVEAVLRGRKATGKRTHI